ncbi:hypothetical protein BKA56DRAFT_716313 [Ilyonectria sp. MPI-CAGE-AT-0026]|nr:hypothetical protein BKA56DRAFT_716313 [Ilyonectria sp. MPI-CAGE-AT-0026]
MHGYSSSEESDDPRRPRAPPATTTTTQDQKKRKKKKLPPQKSINRIWKKFSKRKFQTALAVLPFDPVQPPAISNQPNELLSAGYNRAAEECRRKVEKIIKECKRVNMRYRDPDWDLDWDFKSEKGYCLNSLGGQKFEIGRTTLLNAKANVPKAVKRVHRIFENPTFMKVVDGGDLKQGGLGDCWIMSSLTALASVEDGIKRLCVAHDTKIGIYGFVFYRDGEWIYSIIDDKLYLKSPTWDSPSMQRDLLQQIDREDVENVYRKTYQTGSEALFFAQCKDQNETWVPLLEKAYAKAHGDYASLSGGWIGEGLEDLSGFGNEVRVNEEFLFGASTGLLEYGYGDRNGISEGHAYVIVEAKTLRSGQRLVKLRNPWGKIRKGLWEGAWSDGSKEWTRETQEELNHTFGSDSVFWISYEDLIRKYTHFDRTRLFRDTDWRYCQRWIGVDVPWKANFRLHFRLHYQECPDPKTTCAIPWQLLDDRSVSYVVYLKSVEEVVKRECSERVENEKLAQQAWDHMDKVVKLRNKKEQEKASGCRQKERRKIGKEARNREVAKKQLRRTRRRNSDDARTSDDSNASVSTSSHGHSQVPGFFNRCFGGEEAGGATYQRTSSSSPPAAAEVEEEQNKPAVPRPAYDSAGDSSDSPVEDWEELYSSDDMTRKPRITLSKRRLIVTTTTRRRRRCGSVERIGIIGIRVYSKDEALNSHRHGGRRLLEGGMGEKGALI